MPSIDTDTGFEILKDDVIEGTTAVFTTASVVSESGSPVSSIATLTMSIYDIATGSEIVTNRDVSDGFDPVTSTINVTLGPNDNVIVDHRKSVEKHLLRFDFAYDGGSSKGTQPYVFRVVKVIGPKRSL